VEIKETQQLQISTSSNSTLMKHDQEKLNKLAALLSISPSFAVMHHPTFHTSIECCSFLNHPFLVIDLVHIIYKQKVYCPASQVSLKQS
jgi:hypothetical protein